MAKYHVDTDEEVFRITADSAAIDDEGNLWLRDALNTTVSIFRHKRWNHFIRHNS